MGTGRGERHRQEGRAKQAPSVAERLARMRESIASREDAMPAMKQRTELATAMMARSLELARPHAEDAGEASLRNRLEQLNARRALVRVSRATGEGESDKESRRYMTAVANLARAQRDRQQAGLMTNTSKQPNVDDAQRVIDDHSSAIAWMQKNPLFPVTKEKICKIHAMICKSTRCKEEVGTYRLRNVSCGRNPVTSAEHIDSEMDLFIGLCNTILDGQKGFGIILSAAAIMVSFVDIHPFIDGNGRVGRLLVNWVLKHHGMPFLICLCGSQEQRIIYSQAVKSSLAQGRYEPMVELISKMLDTAWAELDRIDGIAMEAACAERLREDRGRAAKSDCMICLAPAPNIATLCCGAPVHLNCLAQWFGSGSQPKCVQCRAEFPDLAVSPPARVAEADDTTSAHPSLDEEDDTSGTSDTSETEYSTSADTSRANTQRCRLKIGGCGNRGATDCRFKSCGRCCGAMHAAAGTACDRHGLRGAGWTDETVDHIIDMCTNAWGAETVSNPAVLGVAIRCEFTSAASGTDESTDKDDETTTAVHQELAGCRFCSNIAATTCSNNCCARCCHLHGRLSCARHELFMPLEADETIDAIRDYFADAD